MVSAGSTSGDKRANHHHQQQQRQVRVLSVGLPRTGSKSMLRALEILGYGNVHHLGQIWWTPREWEFLDRAADVSFPSLPTHTPALASVDWDEMFGDNEAVTDAAGIFTAQLIEAYPDAKCVLVVRDFDAWARSVDETLLSYLFSCFKYTLFVQASMLFVPLCSCWKHLS
ncbi:hypothetical protein Daus18300_012603 [Diaporthe australafricana]|uniref:P-loop containing nucleoside triphosphate hydrolase protein n=1 Tax=Diaporthe australafricana TaxID=127596 RepID=A0ABR3W2J5_9PEZI